MIEYLKALLFGIIEGITEWLPISSTGHLILLNEFVTLDVSDAFFNMFEVVIQLGAIMAVVILYWNQLWPFAKGEKYFIKKDIFSMWFKIAVACIPAVIIKLLLGDFVKENFYRYEVIACTLIVFGIAFIIIENRNHKLSPKVNSIADITYRSAFIIGLFQVLAAVFPGTSRSGATILGGILIGIARPIAAEFTFFLGVPVMFGAGLMEMVDFGFHYSAQEMIILLIGMIVSFGVSMVVIKFFMGYIKKHDFKVFGWYRIVLGVLVIAYFLLCGPKGAVDYRDAANWAYLPGKVTATNDTVEKSVEELGDKTADCFLICPTVYLGDETHYNMEMTDEDTKANFFGALNMERGIYEASCIMYAPYYRQASLAAYQLTAEEREQYMEYAYKDIRAAFKHYMKHNNDSRPIVLAGFSQGADMALRLLKEYFDDNRYQNRLVAAYIIGAAVTEEDLKNYPQLKMAQGEADTGCIISFNSEAADVNYSVLVPDTTLGINPLNWRTDSTEADASFNKGACFTDYDGNIKEEIPELCGAYLDEKRGTLRITGVTPEQYPPVLDLFESGVYHLYDYQFFYRNLQNNVAVRTVQFQIHSN